MATKAKTEAKTNRVLFSCDPIFVKGFNVHKSEREAAETLRTDDLAIQQAAHRILKAGLIAGYLWPEIALTADVVETAYKVLDKKGKARDDLEKKAEKSARNTISRLMLRYDVKSLEPRGGAREKPPVDPAEAAKAEAAEAEKKAVKNLVATLTVPDMATPDDLAKHLRAVAKGAVAAVKRSEPIFAAIEKDKLAAYRKAVKDFEKAVVALTK